MFRFYFPFLILQAFCIYHAYSRNDMKWAWIVMLVPFIGSLLYLYHAFYNRRNVETVSEGIKSTFNTNYKIEKLEKEILFADTVTNKLALADEYLSQSMYEHAEKMYVSCLSGSSYQDEDIIIKLIKTHYLQENYDQVIFYGEQVLESKTFKHSEEKVALAWAYNHTGKQDLAEKLFESLDKRFSNYTLRYEYAKFLEEAKGPEAAKRKLGELLTEIDSMDNYERKLKKQIYREISSYYKQL